MYKKLIVGLIIVMSPLCCMEKNKRIISGTMMVLTKDIARHQIQPWLTFQEISRLKRLSKHYNKLYDIESNCPYRLEDMCSTYACNRCAQSYYQCTKMLVYFALKRNEQMFNHLWVHHRNIRKRNIVELIKKPRKKSERIIKGEKLFYPKPAITLKDSMHCYRSHYGVSKNIYEHIFDYVMQAIDFQDIVLANTMLSESGLSVFDLLANISLDFDDIDMVFYNACILQNAELIKNICGGKVDDNSFMYVIHYADEQLLFALINENILSADSATKDGKKSVLHYAAERGFENVIKIALEKGAYVNCRDFYERVPLHYAVKKAHRGAVIELLKSPDADVRLKDKKKRTAIDYNVPKRKYLLHVPKRIDVREDIASILKDHRDQHQVAGYSYSRVHANGYQEIHL